MISLKTESWDISNIETVLFDKDGTFIDLHYFWGKMTEMRAKEIIKRYGLDINLFEKICLFLGYDPKSSKMLSDGITALYSRSKIIEIFREKLVEIGVSVSVCELEKIFDFVSCEFYKEIEKYTKTIDSAIRFINDLYLNGVKLGVVTSDSVKSTILTLKQYGWEKYFDVVIGRESSPCTKESGEPTKLALQKLNAKPETAVMIGDAPMDYLSAKNAGINNVILVSTGQIEKEVLMQTSPFSVEDLEEIIIQKTYS